MRKLSAKILRNWIFTIPKKIRETHEIIPGDQIFFDVISLQPKRLLLTFSKPSTKN